MKVNEAKNELPLDYMTNFVSDGWTEVGRLTAEFDAIGKEFKNTAEVKKIIQYLIDAYYVVIGNMQELLGEKTGIDVSEVDEIDEGLTLSEEFAPKAEEPKKPMQAQPAEKPSKKAVDEKPAIRQESFDDCVVETGEDGPQAQTAPTKGEPADFFVDFDDPIPDSEADSAVQEAIQAAGRRQG